MNINVCVFGVSGFTGAKLLYFLNQHTKVKLKGVFGKSTEGSSIKKIYPELDKFQDLIVSDYKKFDFKNIDLIFSCLPHGEFQKEIFNKLDPKIAIIDLSGDFRLKNTDEYELFYEKKHVLKNKKNKFVYGLSELNQEEIVNSKYIANPGCYPTSILIPILPLIKTKLLKNCHLIINSKSGYSGAGRKPKNRNLFKELENNFFSYNVDKHKHFAEINQEIKRYNKNVTFTFIPHILPIFSGIQSNIFLDAKNISASTVVNELKAYFKKEPFIKITSGEPPKLSDVQNTNNILIKVFDDFLKKKVIIISCLDNLVKGAAGQAIQNMNLMFGFKQTTSLIDYEKK